MLPRSLLASPQHSIPPQPTPVSHQPFISFSPASPPSTPSLPHPLPIILSTFPQVVHFILSTSHILSIHSSIISIVAYLFHSPGLISHKFTLSPLLFNLPQHHHTPTLPFPPCPYIPELFPIPPFHPPLARFPTCMFCPQAFPLSPAYLTIPIPRRPPLPPATRDFGLIMRKSPRQAPESG